MTLLIAVLFILLFPQSPKRPVSLAGLRYFSQRESEILAARVLQDDPTKAEARPSVSREELKAAVRYSSSDNICEIEID